VRLALYVCLKNICDGVGGQDVSNGTPLDPPLFWLDNIFNKVITDKGFQGQNRLVKTWQTKEKYLAKKTEKAAKCEIINDNIWLLLYLFFIF
jgi:hypothetical protein